MFVISGTVVINLLAVAFLIIVVLAIFVQRQIFRLRLNSNRSRREPFTPIGNGLSKENKTIILHQIEIAAHIRKSYGPKFRETIMHPDHQNKDYKYRMLALDDINEIDQYLEYVNCGLVRSTNESLYSFLSKLKRLTSLSELGDDIIIKLALLQESARYGVQKFDEEQLTEVRYLLTQLRNIINREHVRLSNICPVVAPSSTMITNGRETMPIDRHRNRRQMSKIDNIDDESEQALMSFNGNETSRSNAQSTSIV